MWMTAAARVRSDRAVSTERTSTQPISTANTAAIAAGSALRSSRIRRERRRTCAIASAKRAGRANSSGVGEDIDIFPAGEIQLGAGRQEAEARLGQLHAALALQHNVQTRFQSM